MLRQSVQVFAVCCVLSMLVCSGSGGRWQEARPQPGDHRQGEEPELQPQEGRGPGRRIGRLDQQARTKHSATSDDDGKTFDTGDIEPGKSSKAVEFEKPGEFKYHCKVHGKTMSGTIVVKAKAK